MGDGVAGGVGVGAGVGVSCSARRGGVLRSSWVGRRGGSVGTPPAPHPLDLGNLLVLLVRVRWVDRGVTRRVGRMGGLD